MPARESRPTTTYAIAPADREPVHERLRAMGGVDEPAGPYEAWRIKLSDAGSPALAILYRSGKLVLSGEAPIFDRAAQVIDALGRKAPSKGRPISKGAPPGAAVPPETEPHVGTDEAGKGDFFGPMVTAGVYVDARTAQILRTLGVRDSKLISDRELRKLAANIREVIADRQRAVLVLAPKRYNELYKQMRGEGKNLNTLLAWTHTRVIEDLIKSGLRPSFILSDQFGDKRYIESRLLLDTRLSGIPVLQMHRAEADVAVAAASILARDAFLRWLDRASKALGLPLPKGASANVIEAGRQLTRGIGADGLRDYAKVSFKTMGKVLAP